MVVLDLLEIVREKWRLEEEEEEEEEEQAQVGRRRGHSPREFVVWSGACGGGGVCKVEKAGRTKEQYEREEDSEREYRTITSSTLHTRYHRTDLNLFYEPRPYHPHLRITGPSLRRREVIGLLPKTVRITLGWIPYSINSARYLGINPAKSGWCGQKCFVSVERERERERERATLNKPMKCRNTTNISDHTKPLLAGLIPR
jgi:hypothetical protein